MAVPRASLSAWSWYVPVARSAGFRPIVYAPRKADHQQYLGRLLSACVPFYLRPSSLISFWVIGPPTLPDRPLDLLRTTADRARDMASGGGRRGALQCNKSAVAWTRHDAVAATREARSGDVHRGM
jgi:hypothetical protein